jgi:S-adenosylmethionine decarboxylase proenzyme
MTGKHLLIDLWTPDREVLLGVEPLWSRLLAATRASGAQILHTHAHQFTPQGMSGFILIAESHVSIHTWPQEGYLAMDILSCGHVDPERLVREFTRELTITRRRVSLQTRGDGGGSSTVVSQETRHG